MRATRIAVHDALQPAAAVGRTLAIPRPDHSHQSFTWSSAHEAFVQESRSGLRLCDLTLLLIGDGVQEFPLRGRTVDDGFRFYEERLGCALDREQTSSDTLEPEEHELAVIARLYAQANRILESLQTRIPNASPVRLWPHHFDIAFLAGSLGIGFLAGDDSIDEPYWYVYNTPMPDPLPPLSLGEWHRGHWTGAILKRDPDPATITKFLEEAITAVRATER